MCDPCLGIGLLLLLQGEGGGSALMTGIGGAGGAGGAGGICCSSSISCRMSDVELSCTGIRCGAGGGAGG